MPEVVTSVLLEAEAAVPAPTLPRDSRRARGLLYAGLALLASPLAATPILASSVAAAPIPTSPASAERLIVRSYTVSDGLASDRVACIATDLDGFLWVCTNAGLSRFDGSRFVTFGTAEGLPDPAVNHFLQTRTGARWVATNGGGVARLEPGIPDPDGRVFTAFEVGTTPRSMRVNILFETREGALLAGTDGGLFRAEAPEPEPRFELVLARVGRGSVHRPVSCSWAGKSSAIAQTWSPLSGKPESARGILQCTALPHDPVARGLAMSYSARTILPLLLLSLHASCATPDPSSASAERMVPTMREGHVDAGGGVQLFYRVVGSGPDTLVILHGGPGFTMEYLADDLAPLAERHTLLFYDQRGTGRSSLVRDPAALDAQRFAEDLEAVRRHFALERLTMLGHSWGAGVAALYAARHPERVGGLLIVGGIPVQRKEHVQTFQKLAASRDSTVRRKMQERREAWHADPGNAEACRAYYELWFLPFYGDRTAAYRSKGDFCAGTPKALRNKVESVDRFTTASLGEWDWRPSLRAVDAPALVIHGTADVFPVEGAREWAAALPNGRLLLLEGIGHFPYLEAPQRFFAIVDEFLQGRWPEGAQTIADSG